MAPSHILSLPLTDFPPLTCRHLGMDISHQVDILHGASALFRLAGAHSGQRGAARERGQPAEPRLPHRVSVRAALLRLLVQGRRRRQLLQQGRSQYQVRPNTVDVIYTDKPEDYGLSDRKWLSWWRARNGQRRPRPSRCSRNPRHLATNSASRDASRSSVAFQDPGPFDGVPEEEEGREKEAEVLVVFDGGGGPDRRRDGRLHAGRRQRDCRRRRDLHLRAVQRQEPLGRRPRRQRKVLG